VAENYGAGSFDSTNLQKLEYYPRLVKGYQNSYPARRILILLPSDARSKESSEHHDDPATTAIGEIVSSSQQVQQRLYASALGPIVQSALAQSAEEAGLTPTPGEKPSYTQVRNKNEDYVIETRIVKCEVKKQRGQDTRFGPTWQTEAQFSLEAVIYKPPFRVPFWQGASSESYYDPPLRGILGPEDRTGIYDQPGQVLSIAMTRAIAGIFKRPELRNLFAEDRARR
jgi:hypothetical protein